MLDIKWIRENPTALSAALQRRGWDSSKADSTVEELLALDETRRAHLGELQSRQERRNTASKEIGNAMRNKDMALADQLKAEVAGIKDWLQGAEQAERDNDKALDDVLAGLPNIPLDDVPVGRDEHDNVEMRRFGDSLIAARAPGMGNRPKEHFEIGEALGLMDFERAAKLSGARFTVLKGQFARLERALGQFMLDLHTTEHGYTEVNPPLLVRQDALYGTGQLPKFADDLFASETSFGFAKQLLNEILAAGFEKVLVDYANVLNAIPVERSGSSVSVTVDEKSSSAMRDFDDDLRPIAQLAPYRYLIPTAEVPLTNLVREEITPAEKLPLRYTALTPCFRSEAGSAGRDTRGMLRQHQFNKVELVSITDQDSSLAEHDRMTACAEEVLKRLELPFRTVVLCTGDMGFGARKTYDIEVWLPGQNAYREISSCSVCGDFQARRMDARYRGKDDKQTRFVHTLNGSGTAVGRALIAVIENYQNADGSVSVPDALKPYMGGLDRIG